MEVTTVAAIIGILVTMGTVQYLEVKRRSREHYCAHRLAQLAVYERLYFREYGDYTDFLGLREAGYIDWDYQWEDDTLLHYQRPVYIQEYELDFNLEEEETGFEIVATPVIQEAHLWYPRWVALGGIPDLRAMYVREDGVVRWVETERPVF
jgi:hypothetical protein